MSNDQQLQVLTQQLNDAFSLLGMKELEIAYLRKQGAQLQAAIKEAAAKDNKPTDPPELSLVK